MIRGLEHLSYEEKSEKQLGNEKAPRRFYDTLQYLKGACNKARERLFTRMCRDRTRDYGLKLKECRFRLDFRKEFFTLCVVRHWNR